MRTLAVLAGVGLAWLAHRTRDPREWPAVVTQEWTRLQADLTEAAQAGAAAAARAHTTMLGDILEARREARQAQGR